MPSGTGAVSFRVDGNAVVADIAGSSLKKGEHVYSLMLVDEATGNPLALYYTKHTTVEADGSGAVRRVGIRFPKGAVKGVLRAYLMVDTYPAAKGSVKI
jgi:hypothetical protein